LLGGDTMAWSGLYTMLCHAFQFIFIFIFFVNVYTIRYRVYTRASLVTHGNSAGIRFAVKKI